MEKVLKTPVMFLGLSFPEHGYHAPNENYDWQQASGGSAMRGVRGVITASLLCAVSCIPYYSPVTIENPDDAQKTKFSGIRASLETQSVVRVLIVHGIGTHGAEPHETTYAHAVLQELQQQLPLKTLSQCKTVDVLPTPFGASSTVDRCSYRYRENRELLVYILTWSKLTEHFEDTILKPDWTKYGHKRVRINRALSRIQDNGRVADATKGEYLLSDELRNRALCGCDPLKIIAFHDPNDLLTFPLPAGWRDRIARTRPEYDPQGFVKLCPKPVEACAPREEVDYVEVINVFLTNEPNRIFNVAVNPAPAHSKYWGNEFLVRYIVEGHTGEQP